MKTSKPILLAVALLSFALIGFALYLQHVQEMAPCPLCVIQRYLFVAIALICLIAAALPRGGAKIASGIGVLAALSGAGVALWHLWVKAHPAVSCGIDPMETALNKIPTATALPWLFQADGFCTTPYPPILGLDIPQWSLLWFLAFALLLLRATFKRAH